MTGDAGDDTLNGGNGADALSGGDDADELSGGAGSDTLDGGAGDDALDGGNGADVLDGGVGDDVLTGGEGTDTMNFGDGTGAEFGNDEVTDLDFDDEDVISVNAAAGFDPASVIVDDDGVNTTLDFGFGTITLDGVSGGGTPFASIDDINDAAGYTAIEVV